MTKAIGAAILGFVGTMFFLNTFFTGRDKLSADTILAHSLLAALGVFLILI